MNEKFKETLANLMQCQSRQKGFQPSMTAMALTPKLDSAGFVQVLNSTK